MTDKGFRGRSGSKDATWPWMDAEPLSGSYVPFRRLRGKSQVALELRIRTLSLSGFLPLLCCPFALFSCELRFGLFLQPLARLALKKASEDQF